MVDPGKVFDCWQCRTLVDVPVPPGNPGTEGGFTCQCGETFHRYEQNTQTAWEFLIRAARLADPGTNVC